MLLHGIVLCRYNSWDGDGHRSCPVYVSYSQATFLCSSDLAGCILNGYNDFNWLTEWLFYGRLQVLQH